jgi:hypothetical protein
MDRKIVRAMKRDETQIRRKLQKLEHSPLKSKRKKAEKFEHKILIPLQHKIAAANRRLKA